MSRLLEIGASKEPVVGHVANPNTPEPYHAARVCVPIVRVMAEVPMCWADRERCADALVETLRQYNDLMREHRMFQRERGAGCQPLSTGGSSE